MLTLGKRIMLAVIVASAIGLSCTACLSTSAINDRPAIQPAAQYQTYTISGSPDTLRVAQANTPISVTHPLPPPSLQQQQSIQLTTNSYVARPTGLVQAGSSVRPVGEVSGIDLTVAEFAQSTYQSPLQYQRTWLPEDVQKLDAGYTFVANKQDTGFGIDVAVRPHVSINARGDVRTTRAGAEVRVGQNLDLRGQTTRNSNWYLFAGADGEAVVWDVRRGGNALSSGQISLQDKVTVGDVQAGIAFQSPAGQMSISYIQREFEYRNGEISRSGEEDFAAVTLTWRR